MRTRTALTAAALATAAALTLTACGDSDSGDDGRSEKIEGAKDPSSETPESPMPEGDAPEGAPDVSLPEDMKLVFDWDEPSKPDHAVAQRDAANYIRSIYRGVAEQEPKDPAAQFYSRDQALTYAQDQIQAYVDGGLTATGTERYYQAEVRSYGTTVGISFCVDQSKIFGKKIKTDEVLRTEESSASYLFYQVSMAKFPGRDDVWQATTIDVEGEATQCEE
ncbi:hypothetical protein O7599_10755 [Streptomyces sp. WMMC500]|uniref:hypothetical protein n=1 Tax=Streptomyces sp. WMMC500 TaxID=3015154 RepID=UPI00248D38F5|nr:hypothetical protein [Streptomyces sp. WMMC500]WBB62970.1 hypothetical protein O7599_10755 [Streptomyces sp. WMMC500]